MLSGLAAVVCLGLISQVVGADSPRPAMTEQSLSGQVIPLTDALEQFHIPADVESIKSQVVLKMSDGSLIPLIRDEASRAFFMDPRLQSRETELRVRRYAGVPYVHVTSFKVLEGGKLRTPEYYCEVCTISTRYPQSCPCCQRPMEFRMRPEGH
jgi:hypothetical protein